MTKVAAFHSTLASEENDPKHHNDDRCPHGRELADNHHVAVGTGGYPLCNWCNTH